MMNLLYIIFSIIQFKYLFIGDLFLPRHFNYAAYARRGFFELLVVSLLNFSVILYTLFQVNKDNKKLYIWIRNLVFLMGACTYIMIYSSFYRMHLYEQNYGYTYLRIFVYFFLFIESLLLLQTFIYIFRPEFNLTKIYIITILFFYTALNYVSIDALIAKNNIDRYFKTGNIDMNYLEVLPSDAIPEITRLLESKNPEIVSSVKEYLKKTKKSLDKMNHWQEFNYADYKAKNILKNINK